MTTVSAARQLLANRDMTLRLCNGEYRVTFSCDTILACLTGVRNRAHALELAERVAYYTDDLCDAISTARSMHLDWIIIDTSHE